MAHEKVFGFCENKCLVETVSKAKYEGDLNIYSQKFSSPVNTPVIIGKYDDKDLYCIRKSFTIDAFTLNTETELELGNFLILNKMVSYLDFYNIIKTDVIKIDTAKAGITTRFDGISYFPYILDSENDIGNRRDFIECKTKIYTGAGSSYNTTTYCLIVTLKNLSKSYSGSLSTPIECSPIKIEVYTYYTN